MPNITNRNLLDALNASVSGINDNINAVKKTSERNERVLRGNGEPGLQDTVRTLVHTTSELAKAVKEHQDILLGDKENDGIVHTVRGIRRRTRAIESLLWAVLGSAITYGVTSFFAARIP